LLAKDSLTPIYLNLLKITWSWATMAHACNPDYLGCRDQEDQGSKPDQANSSLDHILKMPSTKRAVGVAQSVHPDFKPWYHK
jgi:hypothetical protein